MVKEHSKNKNTQSGVWSLEQMKSFVRVLFGESDERNDDIKGEKCCFTNCSRTIGRWGHNANPCVDGRCCSRCNSYVVIPARKRHLPTKN